MPWDAQKVLGRPDLAPLLQELAILHVCGWCALRVAGVREAAAYADAPATAAELVARLDLGSGGVAGAEGLEEGADASPDAAAASAKKRRTDGAPAPAACPLCLGALPAAAGGAGHAAAQLCVALTPPAYPPQPQQQQAAAWSSPAVSPCDDLAAAVAALAGEFAFAPFALDTALPAAVAVRAQALWWRLERGLGPLRPAALHAPERIVDLKEGLRLVVAPRLAALAGAHNDQAAPLRVLLALAWPSAAAEAAWVPGVRQQERDAHRAARPWTTRGRGAKKGGAHPAAGGALASAAIGRTLAGMPAARFAADCLAAAAELAAPPGRATLTLTCTRGPVHVGGRYLKLRRGIPQSPWLVGGPDDERGGAASVQAVVEAAVLPALRCDGATFLSAGREDIDVRMLGEGRPFILEVQNARAALPPGADLSAVEAAINAGGSGVAVRGLRAVSPADVAAMKEGEADKEKSYAAVVWLPRPLTDADVAALEGAAPLVVQQQTPVRVLHRRANLTRPRTIHSMRVERLPAAAAAAAAAAAGSPEGLQQEQQQQQEQPARPERHYFVLHLRTAAGTYVKEFVHGDLGRSAPSVGDLLGCAAQIAYLDVSGIHMDFLLPPAAPASGPPADA